jgi:hypothetical protein
MKLRMSKWGIASGLLLSLLGLAACGGGGGGGGGGSAVPESYTGATTQAALTADNAQAIVAGAWEGGLTGSDLGGVIPLQTGEIASPLALPCLLQLTEALKAPLLRVTPGTAAAIRPAASDSATITGDCGGTAGYSVNLNESTGAFSGSFAFLDYCSGGMNFSGQVNPNTGNISRFTMTFSSLTMEVESQSITLVGNIGFTMTADGDGERDILNIVQIDNTAQKAYWVHNLALTLTYGTESDQVTISGQFYHPDHGYVEISTVSPLIVPWTSDLPTGGTLRFSGRDKTKAELTFNPEGPVLEVDTDGDGTFETMISNPL